MTRSKTTKRALVASVCATLMCIAMLIGTTFAWFTDTASTSVNKIQSGTLDVVLQMKNPEYTGTGDSTHDEWISAEGKTLEFKKAAGHETDAVLWEPGCTYELPALRVVNNGNLALKYKILITGIKGDAKLNEAIEWTISDTSLDADHKLAAGATSEALTIKGHMKEEAGNDYQDLSIDGIAITVVATQDTVEYDSSSNNYDASAEYPVVAVTQVAVDTSSKQTTAEAKIESAQTVSTTDATPIATATIPSGVKTTASDGDTSIQLKLTIDVASVPANFSYDATSQEAKTLEVNMEGLATDNTAPITVTMYVGTNLSGFKLYHNNTAMTSVANAESVSNDQEYYYDSTTGIVTMKTATFSPFTCTYKKPIKTFEDFIAALNAAESGDTITLGAVINPTTDFTFNKSITIDMNNYGFVRGKEADSGYKIEVLPGCNLTMKNGSWTIAEDAAFGDISVCNDEQVDASTTSNNIVFENVKFNGNTKELNNILTVNMQGGMTVSTSFTNCEFKNAKVYFSSFNSGINKITAKFEKCTFTNDIAGTIITNSDGKYYDSNWNTYYYASEDNCITVNNCTFNVKGGKNTWIAAGNGGPTKLVFTNNTVNGTLGDNDAKVAVYNGIDRWSWYGGVTYSGNTLNDYAVEK